MSLARAFFQSTRFGRYFLNLALAGAKNRDKKITDSRGPDTGTALTTNDFNGFNEFEIGNPAEWTASEFVSQPSSIDAIGRQIDAALDGRSIGDSLDDLEQRLDHSDRLVRLLTEKLELTAAELGRVRSRTQSERPDAKLLETLNQEQQSVRLLLSEFKDAWKDRYEGRALRKLSDKLDDILGEIQRLPRSLVAAGVDAPSTPATSGHVSGKEVLNEPTLNVKSSVADSDNETGRIDADEVSLKASLTIVVMSVEELISGGETSGPAKSNEGPDELEDCFSKLTHCPSGDATVEEWRSAVGVRDCCIELLSRQQRQIVAHFNQSLTALTEQWESRNPSDNAARELDTLKALVHEQLRVAEIGISLSRAKVSRERQAMDYERSQPERQWTEPTKPEELSDESPALSRWMRFLGR